MREIISKGLESDSGAANSQDKMTEAIMDNLKATGRVRPGNYGTSVAEGNMALGQDGEYYDEVTGSWLDPELVGQARK